MTASPSGPSEAAQPHGDSADERPAPRKHPWRRAILLVFSVALFTFILWLGGVESWRTVLSGDPWLYLLVFMLTGFVPALSAWRLRTLVQAATGQGVASLQRYFHVNMTAIALGLFLPRNAALLGGKAAYLRTMGVPVIRGTWAVLMENLVDVLFLGAIVVPCGLVLVTDLGAFSFAAALVGLVVLLFVGAVWTRQRDWRGFIGRTVQRVPWIHSRLPIPAGGFVPGPTRAVPMIGVTLAIHVSMAVRAYVIALAIGLEPSWLVFVAAYPITQLGLALAVAPGALGTLDASWLGLLLIGGLSNEDALSFTVALRACIVVFPMLWYGVSALISFASPAEVVAAPQQSAEPGAD